MVVEDAAGLVDQESASELHRVAGPPALPVARAEGAQCLRDGLKSPLLNACRI